jgi:hypothetical protein
LEEVEEFLSQLLGKTSKKASPAEIRFFRVTGTPKRLQISAPIQKNVKFWLTHDTLTCQVRSRKVSLELGDFNVLTEVDGKSVLLIFELKRISKLSTLKKALDSVAGTQHPIFFSRALNGLWRISQQLSTKGIEELSTAPTDFELLVNALSVSPVVESGATDPLARAKLRGLDGRRRLIEQLGGTLTAEEAADLLGISRQAVDKRRNQNQLIGLTQGRRGYAYPAFQFEDGKTLAGFEAVLQELSSHDPWMQLIFFANGSDRLDGRSPLEALRQGELDSVIRAAQNYGEQGAA